MKQTFRARLLPLLLTLALLLTPVVQALTPEQARELLQTHYIDEVPEQVLAQPTVDAMLKALGDPYTDYFTPEEYQLFRGSMVDQRVVGIGVVSSPTDEGALVLEVYAGSPAEAGGLKAGDLITQVDGKSAAGQDTATLSAWMRGEEGTRVKLTYLRDGAEASLTLTRAQIVIPSTSAELLESHVGYLTCTTFGEDTLPHFNEAFDAYGAQADRWIVDLRDNPGGEVEAAWTSAGTFTGEGVLAYLRDSSGAIGAYGNNAPARTEAPVIVLTNSESASAAELFAAGIRDYDRGLIVGERTYGKGVGQSLLDQSVLPEYFPDGDAMKITSFRFYSASGNTTDTVGVVPNLVVPEQYAHYAAYLLCAVPPEGDTAGYLRLDLGWRWYIDLDLALSEGWREVFTSLLEAVPPKAKLLAGTGTGWSETTPQALAEQHGLDGYQTRTFSDTAGSRFGAMIDTLGTYGIVAGPGDGTFNPGGTLTRAQLSSLLAQALHCRVSTGASRFSDVPKDAWYAPAVNALAGMGLVDGVGGGLFRPDDPVTHEQFITIMGRVAQRLNMNMEAAAEEMDPTALEKTAAGYADWALESVWVLTQGHKSYLGSAVNLLWDPAADIDPAAVTTREEAAALVYTTLSNLGILPA